MKKVYIPKAEFYITNVCNLACPGCNRFNDLKFKGWQDWNDYKDVYAEWAKYAKIDKIVILGGEPTLNPTLPDWINGIRQLWPYTPMQILTNGRRLEKNKHVYEACRKSDVLVGISMHHESFKEELFRQINDFLEPPFKHFAEFEDNSLNPRGGHWSFTDANNVFLEVVKQGNFLANALITRPDGTYTLHNSNPEHAHKACCFVEYKNYHFIKGKLYKCGPVALFPDLDEQFGLDLSPEDRQLMNSYKPITVDMLPDFPYQSVEEYLDPIIPQCKFCPAGSEYHVLLPDAILSKINKT